MSEYKPMLGRITLFPNPGSAPSSPLETYRRIWGGDPDNYNKPPNALQPATAQGKRGGLLAACSVHPTRVDFTLAANRRPLSSGQVEIPLLDDASQLRPELKRIIDAIGTGAVSNSVSRAAVSLQFVVPCSTVQAANEMLTSVMPEPYRVRLSGEEDVIFQINLARPASGIENVKLNRITKWSVERLQYMSVEIKPQVQALGGTPLTVRREFISAIVLLDDNNAPSDLALSGRDQTTLLLEELTSTMERQKEIGLNIAGL